MNSRAVAVLFVLIMVISPGFAAAANLIANASFEQGEREPEGWVQAPAGKWLEAGARTGRHCLGLKSEQSALAWTSETIPLEAGQSYRLDGWLRCSKGSARPGFDLLDEAGRVLASAAGPPVTPGHEWRFVAVEKDLPPRATAARVWLRGNGEARLDDVVLAPMISNLFMNPGFDPDAKGRVAFWVEEEQPLAEGTRAGSHKSQPDSERGGSVLLIDAPEGWWAVSSLAYTLPAGIRALQFSGWARVEKGQARILAVWLDDWKKPLRTDTIATITGESAWARYESAELEPPAGAASAKVTALVEKGKASFDDFVWSPAAPASRRSEIVRVHVNQVGYDLTGPKSLVVATNFFPSDSAQGRLDIVTASGASIVSVPLWCGGRIHDGKPDDWGGYFWRADFSGLSRAGTYRAIATFGKARGESPRFQIAPDLLFRETAQLGVDFFFVQRCGFAVPGWYAACHLDDARLPDGTHIDATGGWHSAGDYNKPVWEYGDGGGVYALVKAWQEHPDYFSAYDRNKDGLPDVIDEAKWGADFLPKIQKESGGLWASVNQGPGRTWMKWAPPDKHTDNIIGTEDDPVILEGNGNSPLAIGGWARLSQIMRERGIQNDYLSHAERLWNYMTAQGAGLGYSLLVWSALEMHSVTGQERYRQFARDSVEKMLAGQVEMGRLRGAFGAYGEYDAVAVGLFALAYPNDELVPRIKTALEKFRRFCETTDDNPFGLSKQHVGDPEYFFEPTSTLGHNWELLARAWAGSLTYRLNGDERALRFAVDQIDWVLGKNPYGLCMMEGKGTFNPPKYHHRYATIPGHERGAVPGAIPNGFVRTPYGLDQPGFDMSRDKIPSYRTSEPWLVHNVLHLLAISSLPEREK